MTPDAAAPAAPVPPRSVDAAVEGLPEDLAAMVRAVVRRTRLWRAERIDVALELAQHFRDGLESGATAETLIQAFGDNRTAARLIRRAKKRQRPVLWRAFVRSVQTIGAVFAVVLMIIGFYVVRAIVGKPTITVDYLAELNQNAVGHPAGEVAWPRLRDELNTLRPEFKTAALYTAEEEPIPGNKPWPEVRAWLQGHQAQLTRIRAAAALPHFGFIARHPLAAEEAALWNDVDQTPVVPFVGDWTNSLYGVQLLYLGDMRNMAKALAADMWLAAETGDRARVVADAETLLNFNRHLRELPVFINDLVGMAIFSLLQDRLFWVLEEHPDLLTASDLAQLAHLFAAVDDEDLRARPESERLAFYDAVQRMYTDDGTGDGHLTYTGMAFFSSLVSLTEVSFADRSESIALPMVTMDRRDILQEYDRCMQLMSTRARTPLWDQDSIESVDNQLGAWTASRWMRARMLPIVLLLPAVERASVNGQLTMFRRDATMALLAVQAYRRANGRYPQSLEDVVPRFLPKMPRDAFGGGPIGYHLANGKPVLYSHGADYDDDGGRPHTTEAGLIDQGESMRWRTPANSSVHTPGGARPFSDRVDGDWILFPRIEDETPASAAPVTQRADVHDQTPPRQP